MVERKVSGKMVLTFHAAKKEVRGLDPILEFLQSRQQSA
jgi:hypothetical protein